MSDDDLIRRGDALYALHNDTGLGTAHPAYMTIAAMPATDAPEEIDILRARVEDQAAEIARLTRIIQMQPPRIHTTDAPQTVLQKHPLETETRRALENDDVLGWINSLPMPKKKAIPAIDAREARKAAARLLLDMLHMKNGAHEGVTKDDAQAMWEAASTREGYAAVDAFLRAIIGETRK